MLTVVDVGHGSCAILRPDGKQVVVFDAGQRRSLLEFLLHLEVRKIDKVFLSHADKDHISGLVAVLDSGEVSVSTIYIPIDQLKTSMEFRALQNSLSGAAERGTVIDMCKAGDEIQCANETVVTSLWPTVVALATGQRTVKEGGKGYDPNSLSSVLRVDHRGVGFALITGDMDRKALDELVRLKANLKSQVLVFPHHGGNPGTRKEFEFAKELVSLVQPDYVVFSNGRGGYGAPRRDIVRGVRNGCPGAGIACTQLAEHCSAEAMEAGGHLLNTPSRGKNQGHCCAGTQVYSFDDEKGRAVYHNELHAKFVAKDVPTPICK
jgi:beta-lactamase superfamily II metal-dependent hydrolase